jgi:hypothetical protein
MKLLVRLFVFVSITSGASVATGFVHDASAQYDPAMVNEMLQIMSKHVQEKKLREIPYARLRDVALTVLGLDRRFYLLGETWAVKFTPTGDPNVIAMPMMESQHSSSYIERTPVIYDFRVAEIVSKRLARISIAQRVVSGEQRADSRIDHLIIIMNHQFVPVGKEIHYRDGRPPVIIAMDPQRPSAMGFDAAPIDLPNLASDDGAPARDAAGKPGLEFKTVDVYARPVTVFWREGGLWPAAVRTVAGTAVLMN